VDQLSWWRKELLGKEEALNKKKANGKERRVHDAPLLHFGQGLRALEHGGQEMAARQSARLCVGEKFLFCSSSSTA
jgi:hypothetical protein